MPPQPDYLALSTNLYLYRLITPTGQFPAPGSRYADIRDVAKAHVLALKSPLSSESSIGTKRLLFASLTRFDYPRFFQLVRERRPELSDRLTTVPIPEDTTNTPLFDPERVEKVVGMKREDYTSFEDTVLAAVDSLLEIEKAWIEKGYTIDVPRQ